MDAKMSIPIQYFSTTKNENIEKLAMTNNCRTAHHHSMPDHRRDAGIRSINGGTVES
jgi:hypothetical protein